MRLSAVRFTQGLKELTIRASQLINSYGIFLPGSAPSSGSIPRFKDNEGNLEWYDLEAALEQLSVGTDQAAIDELQNQFSSLASTLTALSQSDANQSTEIVGLINQINNLIETKENKNVAKNLVDDHETRFNHSQFEKVQRVNAVSGLLLQTIQESHPWNEPIDYIFDHFYGSNIGRFGFSNNGSGSSASLITGSSEGYCRITTGTTVNGRAAIRTSLQGMRLAQSGENPDVYRVRGYLSHVMSSSDYSIVRMGFLNSDTGIPGNGVFWEYNASVSPNWILVAINNGQRVQKITSIPVDANINHDWKIRIFASFLGFGAEFFYDDSNIGFISNFENPNSIPSSSGRELGFGVTIIKTVGTTSNNFSIDHLGGGIKQRVEQVNYGSGL